jgi:hypothetical protein
MHHLVSENPLSGQIHHGDVLADIGVISMPWNGLIASPALREHALNRRVD